MDDIERWRAKIDAADIAGLDALADRFEVTREVGEWKAAHEVPAVDPSRELLQFEQIRKLAEEKGVDADLAENILRLIIDRSVRDHKQIRQNHQR